MKSKNEWKYFSFLSHFLITLAANVFVGFIIGYYLDRWLGTVPLFLVIFCFLGFLSGTKSVYGLIMKLDGKGSKKK
ncbi:MAG: AtpZ/AtpI family protein [Turicibacter sp.]|nr:AtpZ/AtpI family protein [Turicibacter sp.]